MKRPAPLFAVAVALVATTACSGKAHHVRADATTSSSDLNATTTLTAAPAVGAPTTTGAQTPTTRRKPKTTTTIACAFHGNRSPKSEPSGETVIYDALNIGPGKCFDFASFRFKQDTIAHLKFVVAPASPPFAYSPSGKPATVKGSSYLRVELDNATGYDFAHKKAAYTGGPTRNPPSTVHRIVQMQELQDSKGTVVWIIGMDAAHPFQVSLQQHPARFVVKVGD